MPIPTEPIGSIPRPPALMEAVREFQAGRLEQEKLDDVFSIRGYTQNSECLAFV